MVITRQATLEDIPAIMKFYGDYWPRKEHILSKDRQLFEYMHVDGDSVNYINLCR